MMGLPSCRDVARELSREQDTPAAGRRRALTLHLMMCRHCRRYARQLAWLRQAMRWARNGATPHRLSAEARARIQERLRDEGDSPRL